MKHPKYRVSDILYMDKVVRQELFDFIRFSVAFYVPFQCRIQLVGSYCFGVARLGSDLDVHLALPDWNRQIPARRWLRGAPKDKNNPKVEENAGLLLRSSTKWLKKTGLSIDYGCQDCETDFYQCHADITEHGNEILHFRDGIKNAPFVVNALVPVMERRQGDQPINISTFNPDTDPQPPVIDQQLYWDHWSFRWMSHEQPKKYPKYNRDPYADEVPYWREKYGDKFLEWKPDDDHNNISG